MQIVVAKPYSGGEGKRVKRGTRFWVAKNSGDEAPDGMLVISWNRWLEMKRSGLAVEDEGEIAPVTAQEAPTPARTPSKAPARGASEGKPAEGRKTKVEPNPRTKTLETHKAPAAAGRPGKDAPSSLSPEAPQTGKSTLKQRGVRRGQRSDGSPSTTPIDSSLGLTPSMDAMPAGGDTTGTPPISETIV